MKPELLKGAFKPFVTPLPKSSAEWDTRRGEIRAALKRLLGDMPPLFTPEPEVIDRQQHDGYVLEKITYDNGVGDTVYGYVLIPAGLSAPGPAILYHHYHGGNYEQGKQEVLRKAFENFGHDFVTGEQLVRAGYTVLCIDAYAFGERRWQGPMGKQEEGRQTEESLFRAFIWQGKTLWGMMVRDDLVALNYLLSRREVDPKRVAAMGMSMGSTRSWWAAAMDERIKVVVSAACLTRYQTLIATGRVREHGIYYYVPNLLKEGIDSESVIALIAPRAHLTLTGALDGGSPAEGVRIINDYQSGLYALLGAPDMFRGVLYDGVKHEYTPTMWRETVDWFKAHV